MKKRLAVITAIVLAGCLQVQANLITITNASFEDSAVEAPPIGWTVLAGTLTARLASGRGIVASDGLNIFSIWTPGAVRQTLGETYQSGFTYTMSVDVYKRTDITAAQTTGWGFGLYYDNGATLTEIAKTQGDANWTGWQQKDLELTVNAGAAYIGKDIVVKLFGAPTSETSDFLDNVRLDVIPEPATIGMLGLGALITMLIRRMRS